jgi:predicted ATPase
MMVNATLKKVIIKNFKSLHDCEIDIGKLNVVVGANTSGKSNLVEAFRLLKKIYVDKDINPFTEWWGYNNVVWQRKEELPITIGLLFEIDGYEVYFETNFTGVGGQFQIYREVIDIRGYLKIEKDGEWIKFKPDINFIESFFKNFQAYEIEFGGKTKITRERNKLKKERKIRVDLEQRLLDESIKKVIYFGFVQSSFIEKNTGKVLNLYYFDFPKRSFKENEKFETISILCPAIKKEPRFFEESIFDIAIYTILSTIGKLLILYPLNIRLMKSPQSFRREEILKEDGSNIASVYHTIYLKEGKIPEEIYNSLSIIFPNIDVRPYLTEDGRVMIKFYEESLELLPPNTSDGLYKLLTIFTAIYLKSPLLIIDEIENSLHPSALELILDTIKVGDTQTIITTHSPIVVDMTELSNIILVEKEQGESKFRRIKDPEKIKEFLIEKGITFSEGWIYGDLFKTEQQA